MHIYQYKSEIIHWNKVKKTNVSKIKNLIRKEGLPHEYRGTTWQNICGSREIRQIESARYGSESLYNDLKNRNKNKYNRKIWLDICSTYTNNNIYLNNTEINLTNISKYATPRQHSLYRILKAFSMFRSDIGYEYGMHNVVGLLLMIMTEHEAFWVLIALTDSGYNLKYKMDEIWKSRKNIDRLWLKLRLYKLQRLIQNKLPKIYKKIWIQYKVEYDFSEFFQTIFLSTNLNVNYEIILRIWDLYINEGEKIIYRVIMGYLKYYKKYLLQCQSQEDIIKILDTGFNNITAKDIEQYFKMCFSEKITHAHLAQLEVEFNKINRKKQK